jgi:AcrR family transcriptional regulator
MGQQSAVSTRDHALNVAASLFFRDGYRSVGVDTISAEANIGKMTLYRHFHSKEELIVAYLRDADTKFWEWFERSTEASVQPREKLSSFFTALETLVTTPECYGCPFLNVTTEYPSLEYPGHRVALEHKESVRRRFRDLGEQAGARDPATLADQLFLLMDGAFMAARMFGPHNPAVHLVDAAELLIAAQTPLGDGLSE